jgi:hypothetical protein
MRIHKFLTTTMFPRKIKFRGTEVPADMKNPAFAALEKSGLARKRK